MKPLLLLLLAAITAGQSQSGVWEPTSLTGRYIKMVYVDRFDNVYAAREGDSVFFRSTDAGTTWQTIRATSIYASPTMIAVSQSGHLFAANFAIGLFRSSDNGATWSNSITSEACASIAIDATGNLFAGLTYTGNGKVFRSTDNGNSWTSTVLPTAPNYATLGFDFNSVGYVFARTIDGIYRSTDGGASWTRMTSGFVRALAMFPSDAMVACDNLVRSTDRGETWIAVSPVGIPMHEYLESFAVGQQEVLYGQTGEGVYQSTDLGSTWTSISAGLPEYVTDVAASRSGLFLYASTYQGVYRKAMNPTGVDQGDSPLPSSAVLYQNYPNPFNPTTNIKFQIPATGFVTLKVVDVLGREVATLANGEMERGSYTLSFDATGLAGGMYFYTLTAGNQTQVRKLMLMK